MRTIIREAPLGVFVAMVMVPLAMAATAVLAGWNARRQAALVAHSTTSLIGTAEDGYREFQGTAEPISGAPVVAPLTSSPCCWYRATVEQWSRRTESGSASKRHHWETIRSVTSSAPFLVRDSSGVCAVRVYDATVTPTDKSEWTGATLEPEDRNPPRVAPSQAAHGLLQVAGGPASQFRYREERIYAGDPLFVIGAFASHRGDGSRDLEHLPPEPEAIAGGPTARPSAATGQGPAPEEPDDAPPIDPWRAADETWHDTLWEQAAQVTAAEIATGGRGRPLVISTTSKQAHQAMNELGGQAAFTVALLPLALAALVLLARFR